MRKEEDMILEKISGASKVLSYGELNFNGTENYDNQQEIVKKKVL